MYLEYDSYKVHGKQKSPIGIIISYETWLHYQEKKEKSLIIRKYDFMEFQLKEKLIDWELIVRDYMYQEQGEVTWLKLGGFDY